MSLVPATTLEENITADVDAMVPAATGLRLVGVDVVEDKGVPAAYEFYIVEGATGAAGTKKKLYKGAASTSEREWYWPGLDFSGGISIDHVSGDFTVSLHTITAPEG